MSTRILIADDHKIVRDGLRSLLQQDADRIVVGEAADGRSAVRLARELAVDLVIMDVGMPELNGIEATRLIVADRRDTRVIALSMHSDRSYVARALQAGASGYLLKDCAFEELDRAITVVGHGKVYLSPGVAGVVVEDYVRRLADAPDPELALITGKERQVLQLVAEGRTTKEIAAALHLSVKTIETHRQNLMAKLDVHSIAELTKLAIRAGLTRLED